MNLLLFNCDSSTAHVDDFSRTTSLLYDFAAVCLYIYDCKGCISSEPVAAASTVLVSTSEREFVKKRLYNKTLCAARPQSYQTYVASAFRTLTLKCIE